MLSKAVFTLLASAALVAAHGQVDEVIIDGKWYRGADNWDSPENKNSPVRRGPQDTGFVDYRNVNKPEIACSSAGFKGTNVVAPIKAGGHIRVRWKGDKGPGNKQWPHPEGPAIAYLASCNGNCKDFDPSGAQFFKISEEGLDTSKEPIRGFNDHVPAGDGLWVQNRQQFDNSYFNVTIPHDIQPGEYLLRHELISLHGAHTRAEGAQYYPSCIQLKVTGGGSAKPKTTPATGLYTVDDGIVNIWEPYPKGIKSYKIPGPALYVPGKAQDPAPAPQPSSTKPTPSNTKTYSPPKPSDPAPSTTKPTPTSKPYKPPTGASTSAPAATTSAKTCKPKKKKSSKRSVADETEELYARALEAAQVKRAHGHHMKRTSF